MRTLLYVKSISYLADAPIMDEKTSQQESLSQENHEPIKCYYHPSKLETKKIKCTSCKNYFCREDNVLISKRGFKTIMCPVCSLKFHTTRFFHVILFFVVLTIIFLIFDIVTPFALYEAITQTRYASEVIPIFTVSIFFLFSTIFLIGASYYDYKLMMKTELQYLPFFQSIEVFHDEKLRSYMLELEEKYQEQIN